MIVGSTPAAADATQRGRQVLPQVFAYGDLLPDRGDVWDTLGTVHDRRGEPQQALRAWRRAERAFRETMDSGADPAAAGGDF